MHAHHAFINQLLSIDRSIARSYLCTYIYIQLNKHACLLIDIYTCRSITATLPRVEEGASCP